MPQPLAYLNGELVAADHAVLSVSDAGVVQGATVSETLRTFGHRLFQLDTHLERFANSLANVGFDVGLDSNLLAGICNEHTQRHGQSGRPQLYQTAQGSRRAAATLAGYLGSGRIVNAPSSSPLPPSSA